jgi:hypothetical protein
MFLNLNSVHAIIIIFTKSLSLGKDVVNMLYGKHLTPMNLNTTLMTKYKPHEPDDNPPGF